MSLLRLFLILGFVATCGHPKSDSSHLDYFGVDSLRTRMEFSTSVDFDLPDNYRGDVSKLFNSRLAPAARDQVDAQVAHLFAAISQHPDYIDNPGAPRNLPHITYGQVERVGTTNVARIHYRYNDIVVFKKKLIRSGEKNISLLLPRNPKTIYADGIPLRGSINYCTDLHYNDSDDHWYFWNPFQDKCPYRKHLADYTVKVDAHLQALPSTKRSYPEYDLLRQSGAVSIMYIVGIDEKFTKSDLGAQTFNDALTALVDKVGFTVAQEPSIHRRILHLTSDGVEYTLDMRLMDQDAAKFMEASADGMRNYDVFIYDGHSGLGGYLSLERFRDEVSSHFQLPKNRYQIFSFNGCSTYSYYNSEFIEMKRSAEAIAKDPDNRRDRSKYLDIVTNGIEADFVVGASSDVELIRGLVSAQRPSWQAILQNIYNAYPSLSPLTMVNGDGDNPRQ